MGEWLQCMLHAQSKKHRQCRFERTYIPNLFFNNIIFQNMSLYVYRDCDFILTGQLEIIQNFEIIIMNEIPGKPKNNIFNFEHYPHPTK